MRSLYWLTAITLVAAAVTTVAIADYGRRHPNFAWFTSTPIQQSETNYGNKNAVVGVLRTEGPTNGAPTYISVAPPAACPTNCDAAPCSGTTCCPTAPPRLEDVPEHQMLREAALKNLASMQEDAAPVPQLPTATPKAPVVDEFTFNAKPLAPLYVPVQPEAKVILPPANMIKEVSKLPVIPGVSAGTMPTNTTTTASPGFNQTQAYVPGTARGPEVMPGLHAAQPTATPEAFNPVQDTMTNVAELISVINPVTYLLSMPMDKKPAKTTAFAEVKQVCTTPEACCDDKLTTCPATAKSDCCKPGAACCVPGSDCCKPAAPTCKADGNCCKASASTLPVGDSEDVLVRTYSIAELVATQADATHESLIELITSMVAPGTWATQNSNIVYYPLGKCIVVRHKNAVQDQVEDLITQLRTQVQKQGKGPIISRMPTLQPMMQFELELVPVTPRECTEGRTRVITNESNRCVGDDEFFGMIPMTPEGRLMPVPMTLPRVESSSLVPAQFATKPNESATFTEGPVAKSQPRPPEFFPWFLPYAPLPEGPATCEEELLNRIGYVNYTDAEIAMLFLYACECDE